MAVCSGVDVAVGAGVGVGVGVGVGAGPTRNWPKAPPTFCSALGPRSRRTPVKIYRPSA